MSLMTQVHKQISQHNILLLHIAGKPAMAVKRAIRVTRRQCGTEDTVEAGHERAQRAAHPVAKMSIIAIIRD